MTWAVFSALLSHWRRNPMQLFTLLAGLALATALWSGVQAVNAEARSSYDAAAATLGEGRFDQLLRDDGQPIDQATFIKLRRAGWLVSPVIEGRIAGQRIVGLDPLTAPGGLGPVTLSDGADLSVFLAGRGQVFGNAATRDALAGQFDADLVLSPDVAPGTALTDIGVAQRILDRPGQIDRLLVASEQPLDRPPLDVVAPQLARQAAQGGADVGRLTDSFHLNLTAFGLLSFAVGTFIVNGAIKLAFEQRRPVIRTLRALGVPLRHLMWLIACELITLALIAGLIGVVLGYVIASLLLPDVAATLRGLYGADVAGTLQFRSGWWLSGIAISVLGTCLAGAGAFWTLARMPVLAAAQQRALTMVARRGATYQAGAALSLLLAAVALAFLGGGLITGFALLAALLIGAALALPLVLDRALRAGQRFARRVTPQWFWADTRQQLPGLSLALMALLLAMAANVGVSTMVSSFRVTFVGFLDQRLASELYLTVDDPVQADAVLTYLDDRVDAFLPIQSVKRTVSGQPAEIYGVRVHSTQRDTWEFLAADARPWDAVAEASGVLVNEQFARRSGLWVGDTLSFDQNSFRIAGVYGDYGNPIGQVILQEQLFATLYPHVQATRFGLRLALDQVPDLVSDLQDDLGLSSNATINQAAIKAFSLEVFERTFTVTGALNILTLAVAGFAILMSLLTLATMRVPQLAPPWAMGMTRRQLGWLELARAVLLATLTVILALPLGLILAWVLLAVVNVAAFGWELPMYFFPLDYMRLGVLAIVAAAVAASWPAWRLSRTPPAALLKVFSHER